METLWETVDRLIHDLGAIRAFMDESEATPEAVAATEAAHVRSAMDDATAAITRIFEDGQKEAVEAAWHAIARAQDAVREARTFIAEARAGRDTASVMRRQAEAQHERARAHHDVVREQSRRVSETYDDVWRTNRPPRRREDEPA